MREASRTCPHTCICVYCFPAASFQLYKGFLTAYLISPKPSCTDNSSPRNIQHHRWRKYFVFRVHIGIYVYALHGCDTVILCENSSSSLLQRQVRKSTSPWIIARLGPLTGPALATWRRPGHVGKDLMLISA